MQTKQLLLSQKKSQYINGEFYWNIINNSSYKYRYTTLNLAVNQSINNFISGNKAHKHTDTQTDRETDKSDKPKYTSPIVWRLTILLTGWLKSKNSGCYCLESVFYYLCKNTSINTVYF